MISRPAVAQAALTGYLCNGDITPIDRTGFALLYLAILAGRSMEVSHVVFESRSLCSVPFAQLANPFSASSDCFRSLHSL
jgi:hypothetical protein